MSSKMNDLMRAAAGHRTTPAPAAPTPTQPVSPTATPEDRAARITAAAAKAGFVYPEVARHFIPADAVYLGAAFDELRRNHPSLFVEGSAPSGVRGSADAGEFGTAPRASSDLNEMLRKAAGLG